MTTTDSKIIICHTCKGEGTVKDGNLHECHNHDIATCDTCNGHGRLKMIVTIKYEQL